MRETPAMLPLVVLLFAPALRGQVDWERVSSITNRSFHAMAPDLAGGGILLFGGGDGDLDHHVLLAARIVRGEEAHHRDQWLLEPLRDVALFHAVVEAFELARIEAAARREQQ